MPSEIIVIDHLPGHAAVDTNVFARDEACLVGTEIQHHIGNVHEISYSSGGLLACVRAGVNGILCADPSGRNGVLELWSAIIKTESPSAREYGKIGLHEEEFRWQENTAKRNGRRR